MARNNARTVALTERVDDDVDEKLDQFSLWIVVPREFPDDEVEALVWLEREALPSIAILNPVAEELDIVELVSCVEAVIVFPVVDNPCWVVVCTALVDALVSRDSVAA